MHVSNAERGVAPSARPISVRRSAAHRTRRASQAQQATADSAAHPQTAGQITRRHALLGASGAAALLAVSRAEAAMQLPAKETVDAESAYIQGALAASPNLTPELRAERIRSMQGSSTSPRHTSPSSAGAAACAEIPCCNLAAAIYCVLRTISCCLSSPQHPAATW